MYGFVDTIEPGKEAIMSIQTTFNHENLDEVLTDDDGSFQTLTVSGRNELIQRINLDDLANMHGSVESGNPTLDIREITVKYKIHDKTNEGFQDRFTRLKDKLSGTRKELYFSDDEHFYRATLSHMEVPEEDSNNLVGNIVFLCSDPHKYSKEEETTKVEDVVMVKNKGNEPTAPVIELTAKKKSTFVMVNNLDDEYNLLGYPLEEGNDKVVEERTLIVSEDGSTLKEWNDSPKIVDESFNEPNGELTGDVTGIYASDYGSSADKNHGGFKIKTLPESLEDFRLETHFDVDTPGVGETFRVEIYMIAEDMSIVGKVGIMDGSPTLKQRIGLVRAGEYAGFGKNYTHYSGNYNHDRVGSSQTWYLRFIREGKEIRTRAARRFRGEQVRGKNGRLLTTNIEHADKKVKYIGVYIGYYKDYKKPRLARINHIDVYRLNKVEEDETPYIFDEGDEIILDHESESVFVNGESYMPLRVVGSDFFHLQKGYNQLEINPPDTFEGAIKHREKYK